MVWRGGFCAPGVWLRAVGLPTGPGAVRSDPAVPTGPDPPAPDRWLPPRRGESSRIAEAVGLGSESPGFSTDRWFPFSLRFLHILLAFYKLEYRLASWPLPTLFRSNCHCPSSCPPS